MLARQQVGGICRAATDAKPSRGCCTTPEKGRARQRELHGNDAVVLEGARLRAPRPIQLPVMLWLFVFVSVAVVPAVVRRALRLWDGTSRGAPASSSSTLAGLLAQRHAWRQEAARLNTPASFVEYAKLQRRIDKLQVEIDALQEKVPARKPAAPMASSIVASVPVAVALAVLAGVFRSANVGYIPPSLLVPPESAPYPIGIVSWIVICNRVWASIAHVGQRASQAGCCL